jgi:hypothetical protein
MNRLTGEQVARVLGIDKMDDHTIVSVIETGASEEELCEAFDLYVSGSKVGPEHNPKIAKICEILSEIDASWNEADGERA